MSTAPYSRIQRVIDATHLEVMRDEGAKFPPPPFTAIVWRSQQVPRSGTGTGTLNNTQLAVTAVVDDVLTFAVTDGGAFPPEGGDMIAVLARLPHTEIGEVVSLSHDFGSNDPPYNVQLHAPNGSIFGVVPGTDNGFGAVALSYRATTPGHWHYRFESANHEGPDGDFYVRFSPSFG
jgi:hypothetical protein